MNIERKHGFTQVCVWPATIVGKEKITEFEQFMRDEFSVEVQYLEEIQTAPDRDEHARRVPNTGGRNDVFFAVRSEDIAHFAVPRLAWGIRWIEDVLSAANYRSPIYPERVLEYRSWNADGGGPVEDLEDEIT